jgi:hypothetical protein
MSWDKNEGRMAYEVAVMRRTILNPAGVQVDIGRLAGRRQDRQ